MKPLEDRAREWLYDREQLSTATPNDLRSLTTLLTEVRGEADGVAMVAQSEAVGVGSPSHVAKRRPLRFLKEHHDPAGSTSTP